MPPHTCRRRCSWSRARALPPARDDVTVELTTQHRQLSTTITAHLLCDCPAHAGARDATFPGRDGAPLLPTLVRLF